MANGRHSFVAFYPSDWMAGTARLPRLHKSVYFDICCYIWDRNEPCPPIEAQVMLSDLKNWRQIVDELVALGKLDRHADGSLSNAKALVESGKSFALWDAKSQGGTTARSHYKSDNKSHGKSDAKKRGGVIGENHNQNQTPSYEGGANPFAGDAWDGWIDMRLKAKKRPTDRALNLAVATLQKLKSEGHKPDDVLNQSTMNGWTGLFPLKENRNGQGKPSGWDVSKWGNPDA